MAKQTKKREYSFGTLSLIEQKDGELRLAVDIEEVEGTSEDLMHKIRAIMCGLSYMYNREGPSIESIGAAYLEGMQTGIEVMQDKIDKASGGGSNSGGEGGLRMGFTAKL